MIDPELSTRCRLLNTFARRPHFRAPQVGSTRPAAPRKDMHPCRLAKTTPIAARRNGKSLMQNLFRRAAPQLVVEGGLRLR
jgi:hypothetical protein